MLKVGRQELRHVGLAKFAAWREGVLTAECEQHRAFPDKGGVKTREAFQDGEAEFGAPVVDAHGPLFYKIEPFKLRNFIYNPTISYNGTILLLVLDHFNRPWMDIGNAFAHND